jgi:hypothetical protein
MHHAKPMQLPQSRQEIPPEPSDLIRRQRGSRQRLVEGLSGQVLHHAIRDARGLGAVVHLDQIGVRGRPRQQPRFPKEPGCQPLAQQVESRGLDHHQAVEPPLARQVQCAHPA